MAFTFFHALLIWKQFLAKVHDQTQVMVCGVGQASLSWSSPSVNWSFKAGMWSLSAPYNASRSRKEQVWKIGFFHMNNSSCQPFMHISSHAFQHPSSKLCRNWLCHWSSPYLTPLPKTGSTHVNIRCVSHASIFCSTLMPMIGICTTKDLPFSPPTQNPWYKTD